jgi:biotin carboxyl carrier protein
MSQASLNSLLTAVRRSGFSRGVVRADGVHLEFGRSAGIATAVPAPPAAPETPAAAAPVDDPVTVVRAAGPGTVRLLVGLDSPVEAGAVVGDLQVHRKSVPIVAPAAGSIAEIFLGTGSFAAYGDAICSTSSSGPAAATPSGTERA